MNGLDASWRSLPWLPDRRPIYEWAADNVDLPPVLTKRGKFDVRDSRHFIEPFDWIRSDLVREVNVRAPVRSGKTLLADVSVPWFRVNDPASTMWVFQTEDIAKEHAEQRAWPILESVSTIKPLLPADRFKKRTTEILFADGLPLHLQGPAISGLQSKGFRLVICDEVWLWKPGILAEAKGRLGDFVRMENSKLLCLSQGGEDGDDWETQFNSGELNEWTVPCLSCGHYQETKWSAFRQDGSRWGITFDAPKDENDRYNVNRAVETVRFICEACGHEHEDSARTRNEWNARGRYLVVGQPNTARKSVHWNAVIDYPWSELVAEWLAARTASKHGNQEPQITFCQKRLAEPKSERTVHSMSQPFAREKIEVDTEKARDGTIRFATFDRQAEDVYWGTIREWKMDGTGSSHRLWFGRCYSDLEIHETCVKYGVSENPNDMTGRCVFVDSGYRAKGDQGVYAACARHGWVALKGSPEPFFWHQIAGSKLQRLFSPITYADPGEGTSMANRAVAPLIRFASQAVTDRLQELIDAGSWIEPVTDDDSEMEREYLRQMSSEFRKKKINKFTGNEELVWVCPSKNNHAFDCSKEQVVAALMAGVL